MKEISAAPKLLTPAYAQEITTKIKHAVEDVWELLRIAHDGRAWEALGYVSWTAYVLAEFKMSKQRSYQLLDYNSVCKSLSDSKASQASLTVSGLTVNDIKQLPEKAVLPLVKVPEEKRAEVLAKAVEASPNGKPTAKTVVAAVDSFLGKPPKPILPKVEDEEKDDADLEEWKARTIEGHRIIAEKDEELRRLSAEDGKAELLVAVQQYHHVNGRVHDLCRKETEILKTLKYCQRVLTDVRKLLGVEKNSQIVAAILAMKKGANEF